jgi:hypothetical protein
MNVLTQPFPGTDEGVDVSRSISNFLNWFG